MVNEFLPTHQSELSLTWNNLTFLPLTCVGRYMVCLFVNQVALANLLEFEQLILPVKIDAVRVLASK